MCETFEIQSLSQKKKEISLHRDKFLLISLFPETNGITTEIRQLPGTWMESPIMFHFWEKD